MGGPARGNENTLSPYESSRKGKNLVKAYILRHSQVFEETDGVEGVKPSQLLVASKPIQVTRINLHGINHPLSVMILELTSPTGES